MMTPEQEAQYALDYGSRDDLKSDEARAAYDRLAAAPRLRISSLSAAPPPAQPPVARSRARFPAGRLATAGVVLLTGLILRAVTGPRAALCSSGIGQFVQGVSSQAYADCSLATGMHTFGEFMFWLGLVGVVGLSIVAAVQHSRP